MQLKVMCYKDRDGNWYPKPKGKKNMYFLDFQDARKFIDNINSKNYTLLVKNSKGYQSPVQDIRKIGKRLKVKVNGTWMTIP